MFKKIVLGAGLLAALLAILIFSGRLPVPGFNKQATPTGEVVMWGTLPQDTVDNVIQRYNTEVKTYRVTYVEIPEAQFSSKLLNALASGQGPDLILAPYQMILENRDRLLPFPLASLTLDSFKNAYVDGAAILLSEQGALGLPVSVEPLMFFYNRTLFSRHGIVIAPTTWDQVTNIVPSLTVVDQNNFFKENGIALGTYNNIDASKDIIMALVSQLGQVPVLREIISQEEKFSVLANTPIDQNSDVMPLTSSVRFFTDFAAPSKTTYAWNSLQPRALDQFAAEKLAMYVGYYGDRQVLQEKNARLDFGVKMLPQAKGYSTLSTGMRMYSIATLKRTSNSFAALSAEGGLTSTTYGPLLAAIVGGISPLRSAIANDQNMDPDVRQSVLVARGWYDISPLTSGQYVQAMLGDILSGKSTVAEATTLFVSRLSELYTH